MFLEQKTHYFAFLGFLIKKVGESGGKWRDFYYLCRRITHLYIYMRFLGNIPAKIDTKGRAFLPSVFRKVLQASGEESLVLRKDAFQPCLVLYPQSVWNQQMDTVRQRLSRWNAAHQNIFRQFVADVETLTLDGNGRLLIPKSYLKKAEIEQSIKFIGMGDTIEIWRHDEEDKPFMEPEEFSKALEEIMGNTFDSPNINYPERE